MIKSAISQFIIQHLLSRYILNKYISRLTPVIRIVLAVSLVIHGISIGLDLPQTSSSYKDIIGCWKGGQVTQTARPDEEYRLFSQKSDGSLEISFCYESGPRSRVWDFDIDVSYEYPAISWLAHTGTVNTDKDTMTILKEWKGESSTWIFSRFQEADLFISQLKSAIGKTYQYTLPEKRNDGWVCTDLEDEGIDKEKIAAFMSRIVQGKHNDIHSVLVAKNGRLILEEYFATQGKRFGPFVTSVFRDKTHHLASTTKGILSTLIGIAIDLGKIKNVDEPIFKYLPEYAHLFTEEKKQIQIKHMLTMTAGLKWEQFQYPWDDPRNNGAAMWKCEDVNAYVLERPQDAEPGEKYTYSNGLPIVLGAVLKNSCDMDVDKFAEKYLFGPLGISEFLWTRYPDGSLETDGGLALRSRDLAKIGQLYLNHGKWEGKQIVSEDWIQESTKREITLKGMMGWGYGYKWMQVELKYNEGVIHSYFVPGDGGQILSVFPELDMVIVFTAGTYDSDAKTACYNMIYRYILPALLETL